MTSGTRIGILGGTFDPVHVGHVDTALAAQRALALDRVLVMPSGTPPHRSSPPSASRFHRFAMAALAVTGLPGLMVSDLEIGVDRAVLHLRHAGAAARHRPPRVADLLHHRRRRVRGDRHVEPLSAGARDGALRGRLATGTRRGGAPVEASGADRADARRGGSRVNHGCRTARSSPRPSKSCSWMRPRVTSRRPRFGGASSRAHQSRVSCPRPSKPTSGNTGSTRAATPTRGSANHLHDDESIGPEHERQADGNDCRRRSRARCARRSTRRRPTSWCSICATRRPSPTSSCCARDRTPGRSRPSPTASKTRSATPACGRRTSRATTAPTGS